MVSLASFFWRYQNSEDLHLHLLDNFLSDDLVLIRFIELSGNVKQHVPDLVKHTVRVNWTPFNILYQRYIQRNFLRLTVTFATISV